MKKTMLTQMALAGITSGLLALSCQAETPATKKADKKKAEPKTDTAAAVADTSAKAVASPAADKQKCKGLNECKGKGGCAMSDKDLAEAAKKMGIPREKAGKAHGCKGHNECKGLGGCNM